MRHDCFSLIVLSTRIAITGVAGLLILGGCRKQESSAAPEEILIGQFAALTGTIATFGQSESKGVRMALEAVNRAGGIGGKPVRLVVEDDQGKPEEAQTVVTKLIDKDRVVAVLGGSASSNSLAAAPVCQARGIPMVSPTSVNLKVTQVGDRIFRVCFTDVFQGEALAELARKRGFDRVAVFQDIKTDYSVGLARHFRDRFTALGGAVIALESYSQGDKDFTAQLTALKARRPDALFLPGYYTEVGLIALQARRLGLSAPLFGGDGWDSSRLLEIGGPALEGSFFATHFTPADPRPALQDFVRAYREKFPGEEPDAMAALAYDGAQLLCDAIRRAGSASPEGLRLALAATRDFPGVTGSISLDKDRNAVKPAIILEVKGGKVVFQEALQSAAPEAVVQGGES